MIVACVVSGGQTGVDRAALDAAIEVGMPYRGWCPAGGWAEDLEDPPGLLATYPLLRETPGRDPRVRTEWNVRDSDATLVLALGDHPGSSGTALAVRTARDLGRSCLVTRPADLVGIHAWLDSLGGSAAAVTLNIGGPRESEEPGLYAAARATLEPVLTASRQG